MELQEERLVLHVGSNQLVWSTREDEITEVALNTAEGTGVVRLKGICLESGQNVSDPKPANNCAVV